MKKTIAMILLAVMLAAMLASCNNKPAANTTPVGITPETEGEEIPVLLPEGTWYDGYVFKVLLSGNFTQNNDFEYKETLETPVNSAKYERMATIQAKYGVGIEQFNKMKFGSSNGSGTGFKELKQSYDSSSYDYDMALVGTYDVSTAAYSGYLTDLNSEEMKYIDLTKSWWDQKANEMLMIDGKMFYTTGDISLTDNIITNCIMFNKGLVLESMQNMNNPYDMVKNNEWTWDNFSVEVRKVSDDLDGNQTMNQNDLYGLLTWNDAILASFSSGLQSVAVINDYNEIELSVYTQKSVSVLNKYIDLIQSSDCVYNYQVLKNSEWDTVRVAMFDNNQVAYSMTTFNTVPKHRNSETDFGILPFPKLDADQESYGHLVSAYHCQFVCVPYFVEDPERTSGIIEELAYDGKISLTKAYYEQTLVGQYVRDDDSVEMLDIIFSSAVYDVGLYYQIGGFKDSIMGMAKSKQNTFANIYEGARETAKSEIEKINTTFQELLGSE